ncbi:MAG: hypothetical protein EBR70_00325 [Verrucomicrobia bacterium]|jgi:hypothetical protein|nr:hypothetical protein [Verrucomicrobiota bacterium]
MPAGLGCLLLLLRVFSLPLSILLARKLGLVTFDDPWDTLWIALLLGVVNVLVRPFVMVFLLFLSAPFLLVLRLPQRATQALVTFGLMYVTNVLMLQLVCRGLMAGVQVPSPWLAPLVISIGSWFIAFSATVQNVPPAPGQGGPRGPKPVDDAIDV